MIPLALQPGLRIGHWTHAEARTGCTVLLFDAPALSAVEVRGAAPGSRELECLAPGRVAQRVNAILLTGGSAFGLAAADGVMRELADRGVGFATATGPVPIVPAAVIYDLANGDALAPTAEEGRQAVLDAKPLPEVNQGATGAGTGATWGKLTGQPRPGGLGIAQEAVGEHMVTAFVVLNALGMVREHGDDPRPAVLRFPGEPPPQRVATTLTAVVTDHPCDHETLMRLCVASHDSLARMVVPAHTMFDGDTAFATTTREGPLDDAARLRLGVAVELAVEGAIRRAASPTDATLGA